MPESTTNGTHRCGSHMDEFVVANLIVVNKKQVCCESYYTPALQFITVMIPETEDTWQEMKMTYASIAN